MLGIIGCGNMGASIAKGVIKAGKKASGLVIYDKNKKKLRQVSGKYRIPVSKSLEELISKSGIILIAVKPQDILQVLEAIKKLYKRQLIISIAAGIPSSFIEKVIGGKVRVVRVMPNLAAKVSQSVSALSKGRFANKSDLKEADSIFSKIGYCLNVDEKAINSITAISGSGPGYFYYFMSCMRKAAVKLGFNEKTAKLLVLHTAQGAVNLLSEKDDFSNLADKVASKGGTTQAALNSFKRDKFCKIVERALKKAKLRAGELSRLC